MPIKWIRMKRMGPNSHAKVTLGGGDYHFDPERQEKGTPMPTNLADQLLKEKPETYEEVNTPWHKEIRDKKRMEYTKEMLQNAPEAMKKALEEKLGVEADEPKPDAKPPASALPKRRRIE